MPDIKSTVKVAEERETLSAKDKALACAREALAYKGQDLVVLDISKFSSFADYFVICSGKSSRQVQGIADKLESGLRDIGIKPLGVEGVKEGQWVLLDYGDVIVHIFYEPVRHFYDLESLWSEAEKMDLGPIDYRPDEVRSEATDE